MNRLDDELSNALRREQPSAGFAERVLAAVPKRAPQRGLPRWFAAAAALVLMSGGVGYEQHRRTQGEQAKEQVMLALRITGSKLKIVKEKIHAIDNARH